MGQKLGTGHLDKSKKAVTEYAGGTADKDGKISGGSWTKLAEYTEPTKCTYNASTCGNISGYKLLTTSEYDTLTENASKVCPATADATTCNNLSGYKLLTTSEYNTLSTAASQVCPTCQPAADATTCNNLSGYKLLSNTEYDTLSTSASKVCPECIYNAATCNNVSGYKLLSNTEYDALSSTDVSKYILPGLRFVSTYDGNTITRHTGILTTLNVTNATTTLTGSGSTARDYIATTAWGLFKVNTSGTYNFRARVDDRLTVIINGQSVISLSTHTPDLTDGSSIYLTAGKYYPIQVYFTELAGADWFQVQMRLSGGTWGGTWIDVSSELFHIGNIEGFILPIQNQYWLLILLLLGYYYYQLKSGQPIDIKIYIGIIVIYFIIFG